MAFIALAAVLVLFGPQLLRMFFWMGKALLKLLMGLVLLGLFLQLFE